jgi:hypothetical protein
MGALSRPARDLAAGGTSAGLLAMVAVLAIGTISVGLRTTPPSPQAPERRLPRRRRHVWKRPPRPGARRANGRRRRSPPSGPDSHIADYLPYLHDHNFAEQARMGIQKVKTRQADAMALLEQRPIGELTELWEWNVLATRQMCEAYGNAFPRRREPHYQGAQRLSRGRDGSRMADAQSQMDDRLEMRLERSARARRNQHQGGG